MQIVAIIQARMGSTRLPGKVMKMLGDRTVLGHVINRCKAIPLVTQVIVATTAAEEDDILCKEAELYGVSYYRGSENNVLSRYYEAAKMAKAEVVVRVTSDCPLLDPQISNSVIKHFLRSECDYASNSLSKTFPRGLDTEVFSFKVLERAYQNAELSFEKEHVTPYLYLHPELFNVEAYYNEKNQSQYRLTLDTEEDWILISSIYSKLYFREIFNFTSILKLFDHEPHLSSINAGVHQKKLGD